MCIIFGPLVGRGTMEEKGPLTISNLGPQIPYWPSIYAKKIILLDVLQNV